MAESREKFEMEESVDSLSHQTPQRSFIYKLLKTFCIILVWLCIGFWSEVNGATFQDLMFLTSSNYETLSRAISMRGAGGLCGCLLGGGYIVDRFHTKVELILAVSLVICASLNTAVPYCPYIEGLFVIYILEGWAEALINIGGQVIIMDIWKDKASGPLHIIHLGYGAGSFIVPQIVKGFISEKLPSDDTAVTNPACAETATFLNTTNKFNFNNTLIANTSLANTTLVNSTTVFPTTTVEEQSQTVQFGFLIISGCIVGIALVWFFFFFCDKKEDSSSNKKEEVQNKTSLKEIFNFNTCSPGHPYFAFLLYVMLFFWIYVAVAGERIGAKYLYSYARGWACFSKDEAADILTAYWISFTAGRFVGFVAGNFVPMKFIIFIEGFGNLAFALVLFFFGENKYVLWVCICGLGLLIGPCYPSGLAWANRYMVVTATGVTVLSVAAGVSDLSFLTAIGYFAERVGIQIMTTFFLGYGIVVSVLPIVMQSIACTRGDRFENN